MCGRYYIGQEEDIIEIRKILNELNRRFHGQKMLAGMRTGEIFPGQDVPIIEAAGNHTDGIHAPGINIGSIQIAGIRTDPSKTEGQNTADNKAGTNPAAGTSEEGRLTDKPQKRVLQPTIMRWGFNRPDRKGLYINARSETAAQKPTFRAAVHQGRVLIPATAYFEWMADPAAHSGSTSKKTKMRIRPEGGGMLWMAGLARAHMLDRDAEANEPQRAFVIITRTAESSIAEVHDRMPLVLGIEDAKDWLFDETAATQILSTPPPAKMEVSRAQI